MSTRLPTPHVRPLPEQLPSLQGAMAVPAASDTVHSEVPLREYLRVIFKYRMLIAATTVVGALIALVVAFTATPRFSATSKIRISTYEPVLTATKIEDMLQQKSKEANYFETQVEELRSYSLADRVLREEEILAHVRRVAQKSWFETIFSRQPEAAAGQQDSIYRVPLEDISRYLGAIAIQPIRRTSLVTISATAEDPELAARMANRHATEYIEWVRENRIQQQAHGLSFLRQQADELRSKVAALEREMAEYAEANAIVAVNKDENITARRMSQLSELLTEATARRIEAEQAYLEAERGELSAGAAFDDPSTLVMRSELAKLEAELSQLSAKFTDQYPRVQQLRSQVEGLRRTIGAQRAQIAMGLKAKFLAAQREEQNLREELQRQTSATFDLSKRQVQYNVLERELNSSRELLENILRQIKETSLTVESNSSNVSVVDYAVVPTRAVFPRKKFMLAIGVLVGLGLGVGLAFLCNYMDDSLRTPEEVLRVLSLPTLGVVPSFEIEAANAPYGRGLLPAEPKLNDLPIMFTQNPQSLASEAYRTIRTAILLSQAGQPPRTILVSSAQSSEGKTTSSINLAASLASAGGRVVIIDADLRRPSMHRHFGRRRELPGLVEVITGQRALEEVEIRDVVKRITYIPSGRIPPNPAELLGSLEMASLLDELSARYDYVIIDSPPVLPVTDAVILARYVDGVVLVVKSGNTPRRVVRDATQRLRVAGARFLGTILNDVDLTGGDYYYYNRYYYSYHSEGGTSDGHDDGASPRHMAGGQAPY